MQDYLLLVEEQLNGITVANIGDIGGEYFDDGRVLEVDNFGFWVGIVSPASIASVVEEQPTLRE